MLQQCQSLRQATLHPCGQPVYAACYGRSQAAITKPKRNPKARSCKPSRWPLQARRTELAAVTELPWETCLFIMNKQPRSQLSMRTACSGATTDQRQERHLSRQRLCARRQLMLCAPNCQTDDAVCIEHVLIGSGVLCWLVVAFGAHNAAPR